MRLVIYKIRAIVIGIFVYSNTLAKFNYMILNFTWNLLHPADAYETESAWFCDLWGDKYPSAWEAIGFSPACIIFGVYRLIKEK